MASQKVIDIGRYLEEIKKESLWLKEEKGAAKSEYVDFVKNPINGFARKYGVDLTRFLICNDDEAFSEEEKKLLGLVSEMEPYCSEMKAYAQERETLENRYKRALEELKDLL
jgi:hypothetical protein